MKKINVVKIQMIKIGELEVEHNRIEKPKDGYEILKKYMEGLDREILVAIALNTKNMVVSIETVSMGSLNSSIVHPRELFKSLILSNAASFVIGHFHPSGDPTPSKEDINITWRIKECSKLLGIELLDHIIIGEDTYISLKEKVLF